MFQRTGTAILFISLAGMLQGQNGNFFAITTQSLPFGALKSAYSAPALTANGSGNYRWSITQGSLPPGLSLGASNGTISGTATAGGTYPFVVTVMDLRSQQTASQGFTIGILNISNSSLPSASTSNFYTVTFNASDGPQGTYTWSIDTPPPGLQLSSNVLSGTPTMSGGPFGFTITVTVTHPPGTVAFPPLTTSQGFSLIVGSGLTIDTPSPLPSGDVGVHYTTDLHVQSGTFPFLWSVDSGLPGGVSIEFSSGSISGTPTAPGTFQFTVMVQDAKQAATTKPFAITINPALTITTTSLPGGTTGTNYAQIITASNGTPPYAFSIANAPPGLSIDPKTGLISGTPTAAGSFSPVVTVKDFASQGFYPGSAMMTYQVTIASSTPQVGVSPKSLSFAGAAGGDSPPVQAIVALPVGVATAGFRLVIDGGQDGSAPPAWLTGTPTSGNTPARLVARVDQGSMPAGNYAGRVRVVDTSNNPTDVPVTLTLTNAGPHLDAVPQDLHFGARVSAPGTLEQIIVVRNSGGGGPLSFSSSVVGGSAWISGVTPSSGQTAHNAPVFLRVRVNTQGLQVGSYHDVIRFSSVGCDPDLKNCDIPVSLFVANSGSILGIDITGVTFHVQGSAFSHAQTVKVLNLGDPGTMVNWSADLPYGPTFVTASPASGAATPASPGMLTLTPNSSAAAPGGNYALVRISAPGALNSPQYMVVVLDQENSASTLPDPTPTGLFFSAAAGGAAPAQQVSINASGTSPFAAATSTSDGGSWLSSSPASGSAGPISVSVNAAGLAPGIYTGEVDISMSGSVVAVSITLVVRPAGTIAALDYMPDYTPQAAGCTATKVALTQTGLVNNFSVPAKWPAALVVQLNDDCGAAVTNGSVVASFSNGDPPLSLRGDGQGGTYSTTWQAGTVTPHMVVTLQAAAGALQPATAQLIGGVSQNQAPVLAKGGTVNAFYRTAGALAPGTVAEVYGSGLATASVSPGVLPLPPTFNSTFMLIGGSSAPLYFLSDGQLDVQIPSELAANQQSSVIVSVNGALTVPDQIDVIPAVPGVAAFADGRLIAQHGLDYSLVDATHPGKPGEYLIMYLAGMGATNPSVTSGAASPAAQATVQPTVTVDGQNAAIAYAGLTPGLAGLYQINFQVPGSAKTGDLTVVVTQNGVAANVTKLAVSQ